MGNRTVCEKCHVGLMVNNLCTNCGYKKETKSTTNALPSGHLLSQGRYRIDRVLGEGGYSITYEATDLQQSQKIAIKEFFPNNVFTRNPNSPEVICTGAQSDASLRHARIRFIEEANLLMSLKHVKGIVNVFHCFEENQTAYYTMTLLQGMDMQQRLMKYNRMSWDDLKPIVIQILPALNAVHAKGYIHRDVTPDNIFLLSNGEVQLLDFGNARRYSQNQQYTAVVKDKFAPREQYSRTGNQGPWTDIYSLCVTIYYALTGNLPQKSTEQNSLKESLPPLHTVVSIPQEVSNAVRIGMSQDERMRYQSVADFYKAMFPAPNTSDKAAFAGSYHTTANPYDSSAVPTLVCAQGRMKGFRIMLPRDQVQTLGRSAGKSIQYPDDSVGVSRNQCTFFLHANGIVYVKDDNSSFGTYINGKKIVAGKWFPLKSGDYISFAKEIYILYAGRSSST